MLCQYGKVVLAEQDHNHMFFLMTYSQQITKLEGGMQGAQKGFQAMELYLKVFENSLARTSEQLYQMIRVREAVRRSHNAFLDEEHSHCL